MSAPFTAFSSLLLFCFLFFFFFNDTATTEIYTLSLHDALPILNPAVCAIRRFSASGLSSQSATIWSRGRRSEEHTSELQSQSNLVCRLLLEKKKKKNKDKNKKNKKKKTDTKQYKKRKKKAKKM